MAPGPYDPEAVFRAMDRLYATGLFDGLWPDASPRSVPPTDAVASAGTPLVVLVEPAPAGSVAGAAGYDTDRDWRLWLTAHSRVLPSLLDLEIAGSANAIEQWVTFGGSLPSLSLPPLRWVAGGFIRNTEIRHVPREAFGEDPDVLRFGGWLGIEIPGITPDRFISITATAESIRERDDAVRTVFGPGVRIGILLSASYVVGGPIEADVDFRFGDGSFQRARVRAAVSIEHGRFLAAMIGDVAASGGAAPLDALPALGDEWKMPGLRWGELRSRAYLVSGIDLAVKGPIGAYPRLRLRGAAVDRPFEIGSEIDRWIAGAEIAAVWVTPIGGAAAGFGVNTRGDTVFRVDVGGAF